MSLRGFTAVSFYQFALAGGEGELGDYYLVASLISQRNEKKSGRKENRVFYEARFCDERRNSCAFQVFCTRDLMQR